MTSRVDPQAQEEDAMANHLSASYEDDDGWIIVRCTCGWEFGPVPDHEIEVDVLMEHAAEMQAS